MPKILRALLISAVATGVVVVAGTLLTGRAIQIVTPRPQRPKHPGEVDADTLGRNEADLLMKELDAQL